MISVLFVCHGNICRSPMAEFVFKDMINKKQLAVGFLYCVCCDEYGGDLEWNRESGLSAGAEGACKAWDFL